MEEIFYLNVPECGKNTKKCILVEWLVPNKSYVHETDIVCSLETSKAVFDVEAQREGYIYFLAEPGQTRKVGEPIGIINSEILDDTILSNILIKLS